MPAPNFPKIEEEILEFWEREKIFEKSLAKEAPKGNFVFFEGPPTANGKPGIHHVEARAFKDLIPRYKTMRGYKVERKAGWDTHGLPVELQVEKALGISGKPQIESLKPTKEESIAFFNQKCKESVWQYLDEWVKLTKRIGFWVDLKDPYITYETPYIESLWWIIKEIWKKKLLVQDFKVVPYCARCGTALSSHEVAQGYKEATDPSVFVRFKLKGEENTFFLVWTTTPWTLNANVALAVGSDIDYIKIKTGEEYLILAKARLEAINSDYEIIELKKGREILGLEYEPLYSFVKPDKPAHKVISGDFVSTTDGTGIVHIAPAFGEDDLRVSKENNLPIIMTIDAEGKFVSAVTPWAGKFVKGADPLIIEELKSRGLLYKSGEIKHEYPFCWRCSTPLLYCARKSWFIKMSSLKDRLLKENKGINWVPAYIKEGRFGEWLSGVKDWAISRERYWGTPLPVWACECGEKKVVGDLNDFPRTDSGNTYYFLRHGEAETNIKNIASSEPESPYGLTANGIKQIEAAAKKLTREKIDLILASPYPRTKQTAKIVSQALKLEFKEEKRLQEMEFGSYNGLPVPEFRAKFPGGELERFGRAPDGGENLNDVIKRQLDLIDELERTEKNKRILFVGHGDPFWVLEGALTGKSAKQIVLQAEAGDYIKNGEVRKLELKTLPRGEDGFVDLHRPYIDSVKFKCDSCGKTMERVPEVMDVWFDSGAMPFAQWHYPFENKEKIDKGLPSKILLGKTWEGEAFPADYIAEAIDQTRGWFYTLLAVSILLDKGKPYKNVISLGHVLDAKGQKMSKSKGNIVDPWKMIEKYGADAIRWYMYTVNQPGDNKKFDETALDEMVKKNFMILWNVHVFGKTYETGSAEKTVTKNSKNVMDRWVIAKLHLTIKNVSEHLDNFRIPDAGREISEFINDLSTWYLRRSRDRFKGSNVDSADAAGTLKNVLITVSKLLAPFTPFFAESLYRELTAEKEKQSVHLELWPEHSARLIDDGLLGDMKTVRALASRALEARSTAQVPVRQVLQKLEVKCKKISPELLEVLRQEVNVKEVRLIESKEQDVVLDTLLSPELRREGLLREITRQVNDLRKIAKLTPADRITLSYSTEGSVLKEVFSSFTKELKADARADEIVAQKTDTQFSKEIEYDGEPLWLGIAKK